MRYGHLVVYASALLVAAALAGTALAAPKAVLWERWLRYEPASAVIIDHSGWDEFLLRYLVVGADGINRVRYGAVTGDDLTALKKYIGQLSAVAVSGLNRNEQRAYWINLYNAVTVMLIVKHYPVASIRDIDISPGWFSDGPWGKKVVSVEGVEVSLDDMEHRILRPIWRDPRLHYSLNCAALGCPNLQARAFTASNAEGLLGAGARQYVNHPRGARVDSGKLRVSSIFKWFREDFGGSDAAVIEHLRKYAVPELRDALGGLEGISGHDYDWGLNNEI